MNDQPYVNLSLDDLCELVLICMADGVPRSEAIIRRLAIKAVDRRILLADIQTAVEELVFRGVLELSERKCWYRLTAAALAEREQGAA